LGVRTDSGSYLVRSYRINGALLSVEEDVAVNVPEERWVVDLALPRGSRPTALCSDIGPFRMVAHRDACLEELREKIGDAVKL
jgi:hypothetical protein